MLIREVEEGLLAIGPPSHAWLSGQLARAWGNPRFGHVHPLEEMCLAAEQHDVGWGAQDLAPLPHPEAGRPRSFMEMPLEMHLEIFTEGPRRMVSQSRYAALLVSMHGWRLYARRDLGQSPPHEAQAIRSFLADQRRFQDELLDTLRSDRLTAAVAQAELVERNSLLVWAWDYLSLALCLDWDPATAQGVPTAEDLVDIELRSADRSGRWRMDPWPFSADTVTLRCEGRRLDGAAPDEDSLYRAFAAARWETLEFTLEPG